MIKLYPHQLESETRCDAAFKRGVQNLLLVEPCGGGKCLGINTPVLMYDGSVKLVQDIKKDDVLIGPDSKPRKVLSTCFGYEQMYEITPIKGDSFTCNKSHILSVRKTNGKIINLSVKEYLQKSNNFKNTTYAWRTGINFKNKKQPIDPYIFGVWLGDGSSRNPEICNVDHEVVAEWFKYANKLNCDVTIKDKHRTPIYHITSLNPKKRSNPFRNFILDFNLFNNKHIPHIYKTGDRKQRLNLLAGIIDSDGYEKNGGYDLIFKQSKLANDIVYLVRSLGLAAYLTKCEKTATNTNSTNWYYRISISGDCTIIPCKVERRKAKQRKMNKNVLNVSFKINPIDEDQYFGFTLDRDGLFVLGDFTVTHNTVMFSNRIKKHNAPACAIVHRKELVAQISVALARYGVDHRVIGPPNIIKFAVQQQMKKVGKAFYHPNAPVGVAGVDTLIRRHHELQRWLKTVTLRVHDEGHHLLRANKWGKADALFSKDSQGLIVTATPKRADGKGLGRNYDGLIDEMIVGRSSRDLINWGFLTDYRIIAPKSDFNRYNIPVSESTGEFTQAGTKKAVRNSQIIGDIVKYYKEYADGLLGVTFVPDVESAHDVARKFRKAGVPAAAVDATTPDKERADAIERLEQRELLQLVNVDLFGEGFDLPAIQLVQMARPTESYSLFHQQFMRALRVMVADDLKSMWGELSIDERLFHIANSEKPKGIIIDHVYNIDTSKGGHGLPDAPQKWTLERRESRSKNKRDDVIPTRTCMNCSNVYERFYKTCPQCGSAPEIIARSSPEFVDGDLTELDEETLAHMRGEVWKIDKPWQVYQAEQSQKGVAPWKANIHVKHHLKHQEMQTALRASIAWYAGFHRALGRSDSEIYQRFYYNFNIDVLTAKALKKNEAAELAERINLKLGELANEKN